MSILTRTSEQQLATLNTLFSRKHQHATSEIAVSPAEETFSWISASHLSSRLWARRSNRKNLFVFELSYQTLVIFVRPASVAYLWRSKLRHFPRHLHRMTTMMMMMSPGMARVERRLRHQAPLTLRCLLKPFLLCVVPPTFLQLVPVRKNEERCPVCCTLRRSREAARIKVAGEAVMLYIHTSLAVGVLMRPFCSLRMAPDPNKHMSIKDTEDGWSSSPVDPLETCRARRSRADWCS